MLNTSLHNKSARMGGGPFTYEKFVNSLSETIARQQLPDQNIIKVNSFICFSQIGIKFEILEYL